MERPLYTRVGFWIGALGPALLTLWVLIEFNTPNPAASNVAGMGAVFLGLLGAVVLGIAWLWAMLQSRAWLASITGAVLGVALALATGLSYGYVKDQAKHRAWAQASAEEAIERERLLLALDAARRNDTAGIHSALATASSFQPAESMCALVATHGRLLHRVLDGAPEISRIDGRTPTGVETESLLGIAAEMVSNDDTVQAKQTMLFVLLEALASRSDGAVVLPAWRSLWESVEQQAGITSTWPPVFAAPGPRTYREYCGGGNDAAMTRMIQYMVPAPEAVDADAAAAQFAQ
ncbi:hypothetical protein [Stenotrophomonas sp. Iso1]|uniref:hypothetical protein n=1 Tax=Stenotrophomonas sp. Iso1 TaxID=2977283 RepID=UPI0022B77CCA|nr:hypothetical protein [Stenotrophomonas sp. Iso1]